MQKKIHILLLKDSADNAGLMMRLLQKSGVAFISEQVETPAAFTRSLERAPPDVIIYDCPLPSFDRDTALAIAREKCPDTPFILITDSLNEEAAIAALKNGATDYVLKHQLSRLALTLERALREAAARREQRRAEQRLRESHQQLHLLTLYLQHVCEEERIRISREVHDELGQALTGLKLQLAWLSKRLPKELKSLHEKIKTMAAEIDGTIQAIRRIATELRPGVLDGAGLIAALEWQAREFENQTGVRCRVQSTVPETLLDQDLNTAFFRIFQEALTNVIRHANATRVEVRFREAGEFLALEISDDGRGISPTEIHNTKSIGLLGIRERAALLGGEVIFQGAPGQGTTVIARIPRPWKNSPPSAAPPDEKINNENSADRRPRGRAAGIETNSCRSFQTRRVR